MYLGFDYFFTYQSEYEDLTHSDVVSPSPEKAERIEKFLQAKRYYNQAQNNRRGRYLAVTKGGRLAFVPDVAELMDKVCILNGANVPFILRVMRKEESLDTGKLEVKVEGTERFQVVGESYVQYMES
jgi:hypothetical protein